jgi:hypothetical protein
MSLLRRLSARIPQHLGDFSQREERSVLLTQRLQMLSSPSLETLSENAHRGTGLDVETGHQYGAVFSEFRVSNQGAFFHLNLTHPERIAMRKYLVEPSCFDQSPSIAQSPKKIDQGRGVHRRPNRRNTSRRRLSEWLRSAAWLDNALTTSGVTLPEFGRRYIYAGKSRSQLVNKWAIGSTLPTRKSVGQVDLALPGTLEVFDHPLFSLLSDEILPERAIRKILRGHIEPENSYHAWQFPNDEMIRRTRNWRPVGLLWDTSNLVERYDLWGFTAIVATVRIAEAQGKDPLHMECCMDMFRALPAALMTPWLLKNSDLLVKCVDRLRNRRLFSMIHFSVNWAAIASQTKHLLESSAESLNEPATYRQDSEVIYPAVVTQGLTNSEIEAAAKSLSSTLKAIQKST